MKLASRPRLLTNLFLGLSVPHKTSTEPTLDLFRGLQQFPQSIYPSSFIANMTRLAPVISIAHGGGPLPLLGDPTQAAITHSLKTRVPQILKLGTQDQPRAIVLVTAHWSTDKVTISSGKKHELYYDYSGFPKEAYTFKYDAPGSPDVAEMVRRALEEGGLASEKNGTRGIPSYSKVSVVASY
jgi:hypothetical protein